MQVALVSTGIFASIGSGIIWFDTNWASCSTAQVSSAWMPPNSTTQTFVFYPDTASYGIPPDADSTVNIELSASSLESFSDPIAVNGIVKRVGYTPPLAPVIISEYITGRADNITLAFYTNTTDMCRVLIWCMRVLYEWPYPTTGTSTDFATSDFATSDFATTDFATTDFATSDFATTDFATTATTDFATSDFATSDFATSATTDFATSDFATSDFATTATTDFATTDFATTDFATSDFVTTATTDFATSEFATSDVLPPPPSRPPPAAAPTPSSMPPSPTGSLIWLIVIPIIILVVSIATLVVSCHPSFTRPSLGHAYWDIDAADE